MDDELEAPQFEHNDVKRASAPNDEAGDGGESSGDEDGADWSKFPSTSTKGPEKPVVIPKRGEKDFEPAEGGETSLQNYSLERSRRAMVGALAGARNISSKSISYALWIPTLERAQVFQARGTHFNSIGHSARRTIHSSPDEPSRTVTNLELLPEEALYLIERGSMLCYKQDIRNRLVDLKEVVGNEGTHASSIGAPMSVQQAYAEMIGTEDLTLERYQCYAYLKRLGFIVTRAQPPWDAPLYPLPPPYVPPSPTPGALTRFRNRRLAPIWTWICTYIPILADVIEDSIWWVKKTAGDAVAAVNLRIKGDPLLLKFNPRWAKTWGFANSLGYPEIFKSLRFIPSGHDVGVKWPTKWGPVRPSPYQVFYHIWKPNTPWKKTAVPKPDFELVVVDARKTPMPTLEELHDLFQTLPPQPPPLPRRRGPANNSEAAKTSTASKQASAIVAPSSSRWTFRSIFFLSRKTSPPPAPAPLKPHPFAAIRAGRKNFIVGVVDQGTTSLFRFGEGCFDEWPVI